jgi:hypothetical protein
MVIVLPTVQFTRYWIAHWRPELQFKLFECDNLIATNALVTRGQAWALGQHSFALDVPTQRACHLVTIVHIYTIQSIAKHWSMLEVLFRICNFLNIYHILLKFQH